MNRIFISYRSSDGKKEADRLCADLSRLFGHEQVFFDKQDLRGGLSWRSAIDAALGARPVVLLLMTPDLLGARLASGARRIDQADDPIRGELLTAQQRGALIIPLLTEGMQAPNAESLPEALRFLAEPHALKLRTEDWANDLNKLVDDLEAQGVERVQETMPPNDHRDQPAPPKRRWPVYLGSGLVLLAILASLDMEENGVPTERPMAATETTPTTHVQPAETHPATQAAMTAELSGAWWSIDSQNRRTGVRLLVRDQEAELRSDPIPVAWYPEWHAFAQRLLSSQGVVINQVVYVAQGERFLNSLNLRFEVFSTEGVGPLDTGSFTLNVSPDGREIHGQLWSNGDQNHLPVRMVRAP